MLVGWIDDFVDCLDCIRIVGPNWRVVLDSARFVRIRRIDVEQAIGGNASYAFGVFGFLCFDRKELTYGPVSVEYLQRGGYSTPVRCAATMADDVSLLDTALTYLAGATFFGNASVEAMACLTGGLGAELVRLNRAITARVVSAPYLERFGPQPTGSRGTIIVCLYGKSEFFFLQQCLYSGLSGIEDFELIYVSNSPEMAESLLREGHAASLTYGLPTGILILGGNAGFGAANNLAARYARSGRVLVLNPDVFPRDRDWAAKHAALVDDVPVEQARLFGAPLYYDDGSLMHGGMYYEVDTGLSLSSGRPVTQHLCRVEHYGKGAPAETPRFTRARAVPGVTGAFMSVDREWFENIGGFTEDYIFGGYEDADLCLKSIARGTAPWIHDIRMWHLEGKGSPHKPARHGASIVNRWLFTQKWATAIQRDLQGQAPTHALLKSFAPSVPARNDRGRAMSPVTPVRRPK